MINVVIPPLPGTFTYSVPDSLATKIGIGDRIEVSFGRRQALGYIVSTATEIQTTDNQKRDFKVKSVEDNSQIYHCFNISQIKWFEWVAEYYGECLANVIDLAIPHPVKANKERKYYLSNKFNNSLIRGSIQQEIITLIRNCNNSLNEKEILYSIPKARQPLTKLVSSGIIEFNESIDLSHGIYNKADPKNNSLVINLTQPQQEIVETLLDCSLNQKATTFLLHGITGSGKTEVYIEAIRVLAAKKIGTLVLVPEIALTPQLIERFIDRLDFPVAVLHSALSKRARWEAWQALLLEKSFIAIGTRSAVFAPVSNLGLIIVDEEHDPSYKQNEGLRYNGRDLAISRGKFINAPVLLGSATPSMESYYNALTKKYRYATLKERPGTSKLPKIECIDMNNSKSWEMPSPNVSPQLFQALRQTIDRKEQAFLLYNRRGFASYLQCESCGKSCYCPNCSVTLTYHQDRNILICHYCNLQQQPPEYCSACIKKINKSLQSSNPTSDINAAGPLSQTKPGKLVQRGSGTEKIFEELSELMPDASIARLDRDAASDLDTYRLILEQVKNQQVAILVGTQMIAKGHDLPNVTLVGVIDCDVGLHMPDFRAAERVFQLLTQASGRAGRSDKPGRVILQTRVPGHASLQMTTLNDYKGFVKHELSSRKAAQYPPFVRLVRIVVSSETRDTGAEVLLTIKQYLTKLNQQETLSLTILGPARTPIERIKTHWRWHLLIKSSSAKKLNRAIRLVQTIKSKIKKARIMVDVDPQEML